MRDNPYSNEFQANENKEQAKVFWLLIIPLTLLWYFEVFSGRVYVTLMLIVMIVLLMLYAEITHPSLGQSLKATYIGIQPILIITMLPKYAIFALCLNFFGLANGFAEVTLFKMPILLGVNAVGWFVLYRFLYLDGYEGAELIKYLFQDSNHFVQITLCYGICFFLLLELAKKKYKEAKIFTKYHETLVSLNKELELTNEKLTSANKDLQDALQEKENFILRFSHEIRNPLNSLLGNIELCYASAEDRGLKSMLTDAKVSGEILLQLLNNVLDTAKVSAGRLEISANPHRIRDFAQRAWVICSEIIHKKGLYGSFAVNLDVPEVLEFDHHRMMQIIINMVSNATKFTDQGYVKIFLDFIEGDEIKPEHMKPEHGKSLIEKLNEECDSRRIDSEEDFAENPKNKYEYLTATKKQFNCDRAKYMASPQRKMELSRVSRNISLINSPLRRSINEDLFNDISNQRNKVGTSGGYIRLEIVDSGRGIKKEDLRTLFEKFKQVDSDSSKRQIGTGLGLWITKEIIGLMNGDIEIYSLPSQGTVLVLLSKSKSCLDPVSEEADERSKVSTQPITKHFTHQQQACKNALIVEDIPYNQEVNKRMLEKCSVENITIVNNGLEALELFKKMGPRYFDLILMDIDMPVMDGKTATKKIRQFEKERGWTPTKLVFLTGFAEARTQKELLDKNGEYRANNFISKPASLDMMMSIVGRNQFFMTEEAKNSTSPISTTVEKSKMHIRDQKNHEGLNSKLIPEKKVVLLVDDDPFNLVMLSRMLEIQGIETLQAKNGKIALDLYEKNWKSIDLILMDCEMPVLDGVEATKLIVENHKKRNVFGKKEPIIYGVTGHTESKYKEKCLAAGMREILEKPITIDMLRDVLFNRSNK